MNVIQDKKYSNKRNLRLFIVLLYQILGVPFQFWVKGGQPSGTYHNLGMKLLILTIFALFEILEYISVYPSKNVWFIKPLFYIRILAVVSALSANYYSTGIIDPYFYTFITLIGFYSYFIFPERVSASVTVFLALVMILFDAENFLHSNLELYYGLILIIQRTMTILIFYLFAKFWDADRNVSYTNDELLKTLSIREEKLKEFAREIAKTSILEERTRIARDMHDSVGHSLTAIQIQLRTAEAFLDVDKDGCRKALNSALEAATSSLQDTRAVLKDLREPELSFSLKEKIEPIIGTLRQSGINVRADIANDNDNMNYASLIALLRFTQEGATNIIKHSQATAVSVTLSYSRDEAILTIEDNGTGFDAKKYLREKKKTGIGLYGLIERFELIRGSVTITSFPGKGAKIEARAPKDPVKLIGRTDESN